jgi:hypothetical protein
MRARGGHLRWQTLHRLRFAASCDASSAGTRLQRVKKRARIALALPSTLLGPLNFVDREHSPTLKVGVKECDFLRYALLQLEKCFGRNECRERLLSRVRRIDFRLSKFSNALELWSTPKLPDQGAADGLRISREFPRESRFARLSGRSCCDPHGQCRLHCRLEAGSFTFRVVIPRLRRHAMKRGNRAAQNRWAPDFPCPCMAQQRVARRIASDADGIQPGFRIRNGKVQSEGIPFLCRHRGEAKAAEKRQHITCESVGCAIIIAHDVRYFRPKIDHVRGNKMGLSFRKSVKAGPFRFNLTGSGVGVSVGVPGFRVGTGPRGNYISMSAGGFTYRTSLGARNSQSSPRLEPLPRNVENTEPRQGQRFIPSGSATVAPLEVIQSADIRQLSDTDSADLVEEITRKRRKLAVWYWPLVLLAALWLKVLSDEGARDPMMLGGLPLASVIGAIACFWLYMWDEARRSTVLFYDFDDRAVQTYEQVLSTFEVLRSCRSSWRVLASGRVLDGRYNAGAAQTLERKTASLGNGGIKHVKCNIDVPWLAAGANTFYFYPDRIFIVSGKQVAVCTYQSLDVEARLTRFIESDGVPSDSNVVGHTWRFVNKNGTPDRRFKDNRQIPIAQYEELQLSSAQGIQELYQFSKAGAAASFATSLSQLGRYGRGSERESIGRRMKT